METDCVQLTEMQKEKNSDLALADLMAMQMGCLLDSLTETSIL